MTEEKVYNKDSQVERPRIEEPVLVRTQSQETTLSPHRGLDIGTNMLVAAYMDADNGATFKMQRDAFYRIEPKSEVNKNSIKMSLDKRGANYIVDTDGSFIVVGEDALDIAIERHDKAERPLQKGVISPQNKNSLPMLKRIIKDIIGPAQGGNAKVVYSVPASPIDTNFDIVYHTEIMGMYLQELGYSSSPINEAFAIALAELLDEGLTGVTLSYGAGMTNCVVIHQGDPLVEFSLTRSGDYIDQSVGKALDMSPSLIQQEKEAGINILAPRNQIEDALSVYYNAVIKYTLENIAYELAQRKKELPIFRNEVPLIVSGGLTLAEGFVPRVKDILARLELPFKVGQVRRAADPMTSVAHGCLLAAHL